MSRQRTDLDKLREFIKYDAFLSELFYKGKLNGKKEMMMETKGKEIGISLSSYKHKKKALMKIFPEFSRILKMCKFNK